MIEAPPENYLVRGVLSFITPKVKTQQTINKYLDDGQEYSKIVHTNLVRIGPSTTLQLIDTYPSITFLRRCRF